MGNGSQGNDGDKGGTIDRQNGKGIEPSYIKCMRLKKPKSLKKVSDCES